MLKLLITCEHGGNQIPSAYAALFENKQEILQSHRGYDIGALELYEKLEDMADKAFCSTTSRLLVELNRSQHHKSLFSAITQSLPDKEKKTILKNYYFPYRNRIEELIQDLVMVGHRVLHISLHSFTPILDGEVRKADIGLLYDPKRSGEHTFCRLWKKELQDQQKELLVRFNYPYLGIADGFATYLRKKFTDEQYIGIELEVNQKYAEEGGEAWLKLQQLIRRSLKNALLQFSPEEKNRASA
ncbi:N-formylglutamate amidohydrolase [Pontibacter korlensis]|uniref:N-formylglutamate amidohydrolase n=1 Tax=Pontibacter korlensis TaxID=400092 RepID=A0A0E3UYP2_9BACT|nr:N-formylglutamate amidohydrolase [Pontibacter korlensis]AKD04621.1 N-formylglutamate amidohydrolase [Pontibacter korlensis]